MNDHQERRIIKHNDNTDLGWRDHHRLILEGGPDQREDGCGCGKIRKTWQAGYEVPRDSDGRPHTVL
jgi:hypothetical protein